jgi:hypothetical protein
MKFTGKTISDMKPLNELLKRLTKLDTTHVEYGYDSTIHASSGLPISELAAIHEYGWYGNPERDFMHQTDINMRLQHNNKMVSDVEEYLYYGGNIVSLYTQFGKLGTDMIKETISSGHFTENSAMTIKLKGRNEPLVDTGELKNGAKHWVIKEPVK